MILIIGSEGNMGRRYQACLNYLQRNYVGYDELVDEYEHLREKLVGVQKIIVATPTPTHLQILEQIGRLRSHSKDWIDVLCEKPISTNLESTKAAYALARNGRFHLYPVNQYQFLPEYKLAGHRRGITQYDYYNSGKDGLAWDCFQLFALANAEIRISNQSPKWICKLNGTKVDLRNMDLAYVNMLSDFLSRKVYMWDEDRVLMATRRIIRYAHTNPA